MWHVDEGGLHAYLDDALDALPGREAERIREHLAACDACRLRLADERGLRAEARAILALASPDVGDLPSLAELEERAGNRGSCGASSHGRWWRLVWAASVVAAGAVGWVLGGRSVPSHGVAGPREITGPGGRAVGPHVSPVGAASRTEDGLKTQNLQAELAPAKADELRETVQPATAPAAESGERAPIDAPTTVAEAAHEGDEVAIPEVGARASDLLPEPRFESLFQPASLGLATRGSGLPTPAVAARRGPVDFRALIPPEREQRAGARSVHLAGSRLAPGSGGASPASGAVVRQAELPAFAFTPPGSAKAAAGVGEDLTPPVSLMVPGLEVVDVSWLQPEGAGGGVRVLQLLESGDTLELIRLPAGSSPPRAGGFQSDGRTQIEQARNGGWLVARARLPRAVLESLVDHLGGG